jgi:cobalt-zinc-cadmium efflux system membrane fusion protein
MDTEGDLKLGETNSVDANSMSMPTKSVPSRPPPKPPSKKRRTLLIAVLCLAVIGAGFFAFKLVKGWISSISSKPQNQAAVAEGGFRPTDAQWENLRVEEVRTLSFRDVRTTDGKIANDDDTTTPVFSPYSGRVTKLFARAGDYVKQGAPLLALDASEFVQAQNDIIAAVAALNTARAQLNMAQTSEKRQHDLYDSKGGALKDWQQSQVDLANAQGNFHSAEIALTAVRNRLRIQGRSDDEIKALENAPDRFTLKPETTVFAPVEGTVTLRQVGLGQYINSASAGASNPVFSIGDMSRVWLLANVREKDAPLMRLGLPVEVHVLAYPDKIFKGKLTYVAASIDPTTRRLAVRAEAENPDGELKPEMFATLDILVGDAVTAPAVPDAAVVYEGDKARVWSVGKDKTVSLREIRPGRNQDGMVEVLSGLQAGDSVITSGSLFIDRAARGD